MTGPINGEFKILAVSSIGPDTFIDLPLNSSTKSKAVLSLFWNSRKGHLVVQAEPTQPLPDRVRFKVLKDISSSLPEVGNRAWLSGWLGESPEHFGLQDHKVVKLSNKSTAWLFEGSNSWVIHVHGRRAAIGETLRNVQQFNSLGFTQLAISMATDPKPMGLGKGKSQLGEIEWQEIEQAVSFAISSGAKKLVIFAWSQGALITGEFLRRSVLAEFVSGVIFDSPLLDYRATMRMHAIKGGLSPELGDRVIDAIVESKAIKLLGYKNVDVDRLSLLKSGISVDVPALVFYSMADGHVEMTGIEKLVEFNSKVSLIEIPDAKHCRLFNEDTETYQRSIEQWLTKHQI